MINMCENIKIFNMIKNASIELSEYLNYDEKWDGYRGKTFSLEIITLAISIARRILLIGFKYGIYPINIIPGPASDGSIDIEFVYSFGIFTISIDSNDYSKLEYLIEINNCCKNDYVDTKNIESLFENEFNGEL